MAEDVCLLLVQSLLGNCDAPVSPTADVQLAEKKSVVPAWDEIAITPSVATAIAPDSTPQFAIPKTADTLTTAPAIAVRDVSSSPDISPLLPVELDIALLQPEATLPILRSPQFSPTATAKPTLVAPSQQRPASGAQLYQQRRLALQSGQLYTRLPVDTFAAQWSRATAQPTHEDWLQLLDREAQAVAAGQGSNRLEVVVGDSLSLWLPADRLPRDRLWLNQSISGDTTRGVLQRVKAFANTQPTRIHLLAGVNDLKNGIPEADIVRNLQLTVQRLQQNHPQAQIIVYSVLPTRRVEIPNDRVQSLNRQLSRMIRQQGVEFRNMHNAFQDSWGQLHADLTTDGLHLNAQGYAVWQRALLAAAG